MASDFPDFPKDDFHGGTPPPPPPPPPPSFNPPPPGTGGIVGRIQRIIMTPNAEWAAIDAEPMTVQGILTTWVLPLAAIGPIAKLLNTLIFWGPAWMVGGIVSAAISYALIVGGTWLLALIIDMLAPNFGGTKNPVQAMKVAAFASTAYYLAGAFQVAWFLSPLMLAGLYSFYLLWVGQPLLMRVHQDKAPGYVIVTIVIDIAIVGVAALILGMIMAMMFFTAAATMPYSRF